MGISDVNLREMTIEDVPMVARIIENELGYKAHPELLIERFKSAKEDKDSVLLVAQIDDQLVGFAHAVPYQCLWYEPIGNLLALAVLKDFQGFGIGSKLLAMVEEKLKANGYNGLRLNSGIQREGAHRFYESREYNREKMQWRFLKLFK